MTLPRPGSLDFTGTRDSVLELLCQGHGVDYTAKSLGIARRTVARIRDEEFRQRFADRERLKQTTALQYDLLLRPLIERYLAAGVDASRHDAETIASLLRDRRRLFALDDPVKLEVRHVEELSDQELAAELERQGVSIRQLPPAASPASLSAPLDTVLDAEVHVREDDAADQPLHLPHPANEHDNDHDRG